MEYIYLAPFLSSFVLSAVLTFAIIKISKKLKFVFKPLARYIHKGDITRLGGGAMIISFVAVTLINNDLVLTKPLLGFLLGVLLILFFGFADDFLNFGHSAQLFFQISVSLIMIFSGVMVDYVSNPFGGMIRLDGTMFYGFPLAGSIFMIFWIVFLINAVNWADGLDGLASGVGSIASVALFFLSTSTLVNQPPLGLISIILFGAIFGFLIFNFYPAKIFMGTSGSMFIGFALAVVSIFSGAKLATLALVLSIPILDAIWVIVQRFRNRQSIFKGDRSHLHYRLMDLGFSQRAIVVFYCLVSSFFGFLALRTNGIGKIIIFSISFLVIVLIFFALSGFLRKKITRI